MVQPSQRVGYSPAFGMFHTPRGNMACMEFRRETSDWNTLTSCLTEDEYGLAGLRLEGLALDVGAHIGGVTIGLALDNPGLRVIAVEALPENAEILARNAEVNGVADRVEVITAAAGFTPGMQVMHYRYRGDETHEHHAFIGNIGLFQGQGPSACPDRTPHDHVTVPIATLADVAPDGAAFLKIDCEGGEWEFLRGDLSRIDVIRGEWHPTDKHTQADLTALLSGFEVTYSGVAGQDDPTTWMGFRAVRR